MENSLIIIQARLSSTRLPRKVLLPLWEGQNLLHLQIERIKQLGIPYVLATTTNRQDDELEQWAQQNRVTFYRGEEQNVLKRFIDCTKEYKADKLIRVCSDNPFLQFDQIPFYLDQLNKGVDYISFCDSQNTPAIKTHWGLFVEGVSLLALEKAQELLRSQPQRAFYQEHVTNFIYERPEIFKVALTKASAIIAKRNDLRFTIDTSEDFQNMARLLKVVNGTGNSLEELIKTTENYPRILVRMQDGIQSFKK